MSWRERMAARIPDVGSEWRWDVALSFASAQQDYVGGGRNAPERGRGLMPRRCSMAPVSVRRQSGGWAGAEADRAAGDRVSDDRAGETCASEICAREILPAPDERDHAGQTGKSPVTSW